MYLKLWILQVTCFVHNTTLGLEDALFVVGVLVVLVVGCVSIALSRYSTCFAGSVYPYLICTFVSPLEHILGWFKYCVLPYSKDILTLSKFSIVVLLQTVFVLWFEKNCLLSDRWQQYTVIFIPRKYQKLISRKCIQNVIRIMVAILSRLEGVREISSKISPARFSIINVMRPERNDFTDDILKFIFLNENCCIFI